MYKCSSSLYLVISILLHTLTQAIMHTYITLEPQGEEENLEDFFVEDFTCEELKQLCVTHQFLTRRFRGGASGWTSRGVKLYGRLKVPTVLEAATEIQKTRTSLGGAINTQNQISYKSEMSSEIESAYRSGSDSFRICVTDRSSHEIDFERMVCRAQ